MVAVMGMPFDRVQCPVATTGTGTITVTDPDPQYMRPYDAGVRNGNTVTIVIVEGNNFELTEATAQNCTSSSCDFSRNTVRYSSVEGVVSQDKLDLQGTAHVAIVAGAADLAVHYGGVINGDVVLNGNLKVTGVLTAQARIGITDGSEANPGDIGEFVSAQLSVFGPTPLASDTDQPVVALPLTAGDWDVWAEAGFSLAGFDPSDEVSLYGWINPYGQTAPPYDQFGGGNAMSGPAPTVPQVILSVPTVRVLTASSVIVILGGTASYTNGEVAGWGQIMARRRR